ncbi:50S ribosomal protein L10 [Candidatus Foliamicus sp.]
MPLNLQRKKELVEDLRATAENAVAAAAADYRGLNVAEMTDLRRQARGAGVTLRVVKNTLSRRAVKDTPCESLAEALTGPMLLAFSTDDPGAIARLFKDFAKQHELLEPRGFVLDGVLYAGDQTDRIATLPTLDGARAKLLGALKAPMQKLAATLAEPPAKLARLLEARRGQAGAD